MTDSQQGAPLGRRDIESLLEHEEFVRQISMRFTSDHQMAEDVAQQVWVAALSNPPRHRKNLRGWLSRLVRSSLADRVRTEGRRRDHEAMFSREVPSSTDPASIEEDYSALFAGLAELSPKYQDVIRLRYMEGLRRSDVAERLGVSIETVKTRQRRALEQLRGRLERERFGTPVLFLWFRDLGSRVDAWLTTGTVKVALSLAGLVLFVFGLHALSSTRPDHAPAALERNADSVLPPAMVVVERDDGKRTSTGRATPPEEAPGATNSPTELASPAELEITLIWADSQSAAVGVELIAELPGGPTRRIASDGSGRVLLKDVAAGLWTLTPERGELRQVRVLAEGRSHCRLELPRGIEVAGRALTRLTDRACPGLELWVSFPGRADVGRTLGRLQDDGHFFASGVDPNAWLGIVEDGWFRSTKLLQARSVLVGEHKIVLPISEELYPVVSGTVMGEAGPVEGAQVRIVLPTDLESTPRLEEDRRYWMPVPRKAARTDSAGRFEIFGAQLRGNRSVVANAEGFVPASVDFASMEPRIDFDLTVGHVLTGHLTAESGLSVGEAVVEASWSGLRKPLRTRAGASGVFTLEGLPAVPVRIRAYGRDLRGRPIWKEGSIDLGTLESTDAEPLRWDRALELGHGIYGVLVDSDGAARVGWTLSLEPKGPMESGASKALARTLSDARGRFAFTALFHGDYELTAAPPDCPDWALARRSVVCETGSSSSEMRWVVPEQVPAKGSLKGRLVEGLDHVAVGKVGLELISESLWAPRRSSTVANTGAFEFVDLPAGSYQLRCIADAGPSRPLRDSIRITGHTDLGEVLREPRGTVRVWIHPAEGAQRIPAQLVLSRLVAGEYHPVRRGETIPAEAGWWELGDLVPGEYRLRATAARRVNRTMEMRIEPGKTQELQVGLERGVRFKLALDYAATAGPVSGLEIDVWTPQGDELLKVRTQANRAGGTFTRGVILPARTLQLVARLRSAGVVVAELSQDLHISDGLEGRELPLRLR